MRQLRQFWNQNERGDKKDPNFNRWRPAVSILSQNIPACSWIPLFQISHFFYAITKQNPILRFNSCLGLLGINTNNLVKFTMGKHFYWLFILINSVVEMNIQEKVQKLIYGVKNHRKHKYISWTLLCLDTSLWFCYHSNGHIQLFGKRINNESI